MLLLNDMIYARKVYKSYKASEYYGYGDRNIGFDPSEKEYRQQHESDFIIAESAARYFKSHGITKLPKYKTLQAEIEQLTARKNAAYNDYREKKDRYQTLQTIKRNIEQMTQGTPSQRRTKEQER